MTRRLSSICLAAIALAVCLLPACDKGGPKTPEERVVHGTPAIERAADGTLSAICVNSSKRVYHVVLDEKGKQLADMEGMRLAVTGMYERKGEERWLTVSDIRDKDAPD